MSDVDAAQVVESTNEQSTNQATNQSTEQSNESLSEPSTDQSNDPSIDQPSENMSSESLPETVSEPASTDQSIDQSNSAEQPVDESINAQTTDQSAEQPIESTNVETSAASEEQSEATDQSTNQSTDEPAVSEPVDAVSAQPDQQHDQQPDQQHETNSTLSTATSDSQSIDQSTVDQSTVDQSTVDQSIVDQSTVDQSTVEPVAESGDAPPDVEEVAPESKPEIVEESKSMDDQSTNQSTEESKTADFDFPQKEESKEESPAFEKKESVPIDQRALLRKELMDFVTYVIQYQPVDAFKQIESIISSMKSNKSISQTSDVSPISHIVDNKDRLVLLNYLKSLTDKPIKPINPDDEDAEPEAEPEPADIPEFVPKLLRDFALFSQAGLAISNDEYQMLDRAIISLAQQTEGLESIRFWGKILAVNGKDYYIAECKKSDYSAEEEVDRVFNEKILNETGELVAERAEVWGAGANEFVYYVCQSIDQSINPWTPTKWSALPSVTPIQICAARGSKRLLTGDLTAAVGGFPRFPGNESHYLRTQIARISHSTIIAPQGAWKEEEGGVVMENDEFKANPVNEAVSWQHIRGHLRGEGRVEPFVDEEADQTEEEQARPKEPVEPLVPSLRATVDDSHSVGPRVWSYRANLAIDCGFQPVQKPSNPDEEEEEAPPASEPHCVYSAHSLLWPGAVSVVHGRNYASCYVGWGLKIDRNTAYRPPPPAPFQQEYNSQSMVQQIEPKPTEAELEELKREQEEEAERKKEEGEKPVEEEEEDPLVDDEPEEQPEE